MDFIRDILHDGNKRANAIAEETLDQVREAMGMKYWFFPLLAASAVSPQLGSTRRFCIATQQAADFTPSYSQNSAHGRANLPHSMRSEQSPLQTWQSLLAKNPYSCFMTVFAALSPFRGADFVFSGGLSPFQGADAQVDTAWKWRNDVSTDGFLLKVQRMSSPLKRR